MISCPSCHAEQPESNAYCSACGVAMRAGFAATVALPAGGSPVANSAGSSSSVNSLHGRFLPGSNVAERYRIVSLVGRGGMGEVYRADDLKLGQTVALKFLPQDLSKDPQRLEYFLNEVRLTRQISHPNVCRVYDVGEFAGQHYLSMEYIDGEDLRALLRRIGRLPHDKGVQIAQQLSAGLAAAHERGVLHRDLKPANIMIDGRGHARITDFGLARLAVEVGQGEVAGTPAYMAPEQLMRGEATIQSDLFALGLILAEIFTGRKALKSDSIAGLIDEHKSSLSQTVTLAEDIDPMVQRVIRRCLEREPHERPVSARAVAAGLPGGDPLEAALAAGETPSPEMVAASGKSGQLSMQTAGTCLATLLVGLVCLTVILGLRSVTIDLDRSADGYAERAKNMLEGLGLRDGEVYEDWGFVETEAAPRRMDFWYRRSPTRLIPVLDARHVRGPRVVALQNPPPLVPGMVSVRLNGSGELRELLVIPSREMMTQLPDAGAGNSNDDAAKGKVTALFDLARLRRETFQLDPVKWTLEDLQDWMPPVSDRAYSLLPIPRPADPTVDRAAENVEATGDGAASGVTRVNIAELDGQIVLFHVVDAAAPTPQTSSALQDPEPKLGPAVSVLVTLIAMVLAWRNILAGRSDLSGARWLALVVFIACFADAALASVPAPGVLLTGLLLALAAAARFWVYYVALEPLARRYWPDMLVNWSRGLAGRVGDPGVGRSILYGMLTAVLFTLFTFGLLAVAPKTNPQTLCGTRFLLAQLADSLEHALGMPLQIAVIMVLVRVVVRNVWLPVIAAACLAVAWHPNLFAPLWSAKSEFTPHAIADIVAYTLYYATAGALIARLGLLAACWFMLCHGFFRFFPWSADLGGPDLPGTVFAVVAILICALFGFCTSLGGPSTLRNQPMDPT